MGAKPLRFMFEKINGFFKVHNRIRYLVLFDHGDAMKFVIILNIL